MQHHINQQSFVTTLSHAQKYEGKKIVREKEKEKKNVANKHPQLKSRNETIQRVFSQMQLSPKPDI